MHFNDSFDRIVYRYAAGEAASLNCSQYEVMVVCEGRTWCTIICWRQVPNMISNTQSFFFKLLHCKSVIHLNTNTKHWRYQQKCGMNSSCTWLRVDLRANRATTHKKMRTTNTQPELINRMDSIQRICCWRTKRWTAWLHETHGNSEIRNKWNLLLLKCLVLALSL